MKNKILYFHSEPNELPVQQKSITLAGLDYLSSNAYKESTTSLSSVAYYQSERPQMGDDVPLDSRRGVDENDLYEASLDARERIGQKRRVAKRNAKKESE